MHCKIERVLLKGFIYKNERLLFVLIWTPRKYCKQEEWRIELK